MSSKFSKNYNLYRLALGLIILATIIPFWVAGHKPMWQISIPTIIVVTFIGVMVARHTRVGNWLKQ